MKTQTKTLLTALASSAFAATSANAATIDATRLSVDHIVAASQSNGPPTGYVENDANGGLIGVTGSSTSSTRHESVLLFGYELPTLAAGHTIESFELSFDITALRDHSQDDYELDVYLLDKATPDETDYFRGASDPDNDLLGSTFVDDGGTDSSVNLSTPVSVTHSISAGDALATLQGFYGGDHIPDQTEVFFRFNLDKQFGGLGGQALNRYFVDDDVSTSSLTITSVPEPGAMLFGAVGLGGLIARRRRRSAQ